MDYMSRFNFDIMYVKGELNKVADCLSWYYENDNESNVYEPHEYVHTDVRINPTEEDLPVPRYHKIAEKVIEIRTLRDGEIRRSKRLQEQCEERAIEAQVMAEADGRGMTTPPTMDNPSEPNDPGTTIADGDTLLEDTLFQRQENEQPATLNDDGFIQTIKDCYLRDKLFELILEKLEDYNTFSV
jgi:hypothetical protein